MAGPAEVAPHRSFERQLVTSLDRLVVRHGTGLRPPAAPPPPPRGRRAVCPIIHSTKRAINTQRARRRGPDAPPRRRPRADGASKKQNKRGSLKENPPAANFC